MMSFVDQHSLSAPTRSRSQRDESEQSTQMRKYDVMLRLPRKFNAVCTPRSMIMLFGHVNQMQRLHAYKDTNHHSLASDHPER